MYVWCVCVCMCVRAKKISTCIIRRGALLRLPSRCLFRGKTNSQLCAVTFVKANIYIGSCLCGLFELPQLGVERSSNAVVSKLRTSNPAPSPESVIWIYQNLL